MYRPAFGHGLALFISQFMAKIERVIFLPSTLLMTHCVDLTYQAAISSKDLYFHQVLYGALIDMGQGQAVLLSLDTVHVEPYLVSESGLVTGGRMIGGGGGAGGQSSVGPLGPRQVQAAELLAKLYIGRGR